MEERGRREEKGAPAGGATSGGVHEGGSKPTGGKRGRREREWEMTWRRRKRGWAEDYLLIIQLNPSNFKPMHISPSSLGLQVYTCGPLVQ